VGVFSRKIKEFNRIGRIYRINSMIIYTFKNFIAIASFITNEHEINKTFIILKYFDPVKFPVF
jgi:hypothetical protein